MKTTLRRSYSCEILLLVQKTLDLDIQKVDPVSSVRNIAPEYYSNRVIWFDLSKVFVFIRLLIKYDKSCIPESGSIH